MGMRRNPKKEENNTPKLSMEALKRSLQIFRYVLPYKWYFILGLLFLSTGSLLFLVIMKIPGEFLNVISGKPQYGLSLNQLFILLLAFLGIQGLFSYLRVRIFAYVSEKSMALLRKELYQKLVTLSIPFFEEQRVGELTSRITNDVTQVQGIVSVTLAEFIRQIITLVGAIAIILFTMSNLGLIMLATFPVVVITAMFFGRYIRNLMKERQEFLAQSNVVVEETMQNIDNVKAFTNESFEINRYTSKLSDTVRSALKAANMRGLFVSFIIFVMLGALFFIMWRAAIMVNNGELLEGGFLDFVVYTGMIGGAIASIGSFYTEIVSAVGSTERIIEIMGKPSEIGVKQLEIAQTRKISGQIEYKNVQFSYPTRKDVEVLKGIHFKIDPGQKVALVGSSGSGKSTIFKLLLRFYDLDKGEILVDDQNVKAFDLVEYRRNIGIVPQEVLLFGGSIRENILYGRPEATEKDIIEASKKANAWEFIESFPEGLETVVGDRGIKLSGGQKQRIAIARAILKNPSILLLDEATSSLDAESEKVVQEALNRLMEGRTSIIIAHRLSTIRSADCIYVIDNGRIVESGTHQELSLIEDGIYNNLARLQFELSE